MEQKIKQVNKSKKVKQKIKQILGLSGYRRAPHKNWNFVNLPIFQILSLRIRKHF